MASDGQIVFEVTADGKHAIADIKDITRAIQQESGKWDDAAKQSTDNISNSFSGMLKKIVAGFSAIKIGKALLDIGKDAIEAASALEEVQNVVDVTFGDKASQIDQWAKAAGTQFGLTETQAKKFTSTLGAMMKSAGVSGNEITQMSTDLAGLAADMASFYNLDFEEAFQKIRSGISGETEPLKQLGINMSVANLEAYALSQGISKTFNEMSQGEQTMLRYQYLMSATADAQGDFARTSDGYANSMRQLETNIESLKTSLGMILIPAMKDATGWLNSFLQSLMPEEKQKTVIDTFNEIDVDTNKKLEDIQKVADEAQAVIDKLEIIGGSDAGTFLALGTGNEESVKGLQALGYSTEQITDKQREWIKQCKALVNIIPGLSEVINTETGEINGGIGALTEYVDEWKTAQEKLLYWKAYYAKKDALQTSADSLYSLEIEAEGARRAAEKARKAYDKAFEDAGGSSFSYVYGVKVAEGTVTAEDTATYNKLIQLSEDVAKKEKEATDAEEAYNTAIKANAEAVDKLANMEEVLIERYGEAEEATEDATTAQEKYLESVGKTETEVNVLVENATEALKALNEYTQGVRDSVGKALDSVAKGLDAVDYTKFETINQKLGELTEKQAGLEVGSEAWKEIQKEIDKTNESLINTNKIYSNLESQSEFLSDYLANLQKAQAMGLSNELLASLSDGSVESAQYLSALVNDTTGKTAKEIDTLYGEVQKKKQELTDALTGQQLSVDEVYQNLAEQAKAAVEALDLESEASTNTQNTMTGIVDTLNSNVPSVAAAVDNILAELERLNSFNASVNFGLGGLSSFFIPQHETGLDVVPWDGYLASLHAGEGILTAEENRVWQRFKNGGVGTDYETMGSVMRDNIKAGGNVYLDGRVVGSVISDQQGRAYRQLQRSGWQG